MTFKSSNPKQEYVAAIEQAALFDFSHLGLILVRGKDQRDFLQRILSNDIHKLMPCSGQLALLLNNTGKVLADLRLFATQQEIFCLVEPFLVSKILAALEKYLFHEEVILEDVSQKFGKFLIYGPQAGELCSAYKAKDSCVQIFQWDSKSYYILAPADKTPALTDRLSQIFSSVQVAGMETWNVLRVENGVPLYGKEIDETVLPEEVGLRAAVSLQKGCFIGQEAVAKMANLGKPRKYLVGLLWPTPPKNLAAEGKLFVQQTECGAITSCVHSLSLNQLIGLGIVKRGLQAPGTKLQDTGGNAVFVSSLPFANAPKGC